MVTSIFRIDLKERLTFRPRRKYGEESEIGVINQRFILKLFGSKANFKKIKKSKCQGKERIIGSSSGRKENYRKGFKKAAI